MANNHYLATILDPNHPPEGIGIFLAPAQKIIGQLYAPSRKQAQSFLDRHYQGAKALLARSAKKEQAINYPVLLGKPTNNDRGAGRKSTGHSLKIQLNGLTAQELAKLAAEAKNSNRSNYLVGLIRSDLTKNN
jgi:hypothetical protein